MGSYHPGTLAYGSCILYLDMSPYQTHSIFSPPLAYAEEFPAPKLGMKPNVKGNLSPTPRPSIQGVEALYHAAQGRYALALIAKHWLQPKSSVYLPAYHCPALVIPFLWAGHSIKYYPLNEDLSPNLENLPPSKKNTDICLFVRYFGWTCSIDSAIDTARSAGYLCLEDLAMPPIVSSCMAILVLPAYESFIPFKMAPRY